MEQERITLTDNQRSPGFIFCIVFCRSVFVLLFVAIVLSIPPFMASDYPFGIFKHSFCKLVFVDNISEILLN